MAAPPRDSFKMAIPPRDLDSLGPAGPVRPPVREFWAKVDNLFYATLRHAERAFLANVIVNLIVVALGVLLIVSALASSWMRGTDVFSVAFAGIGVVDLVAIFFVNPQKGIHKTIGNLVQIQIAYRTFLSQLESLSDYDYRQFALGNRTLEDVTKTNDALAKASLEAIQAIQKYIEESPPQERTGPAP